MHSAPANQPSDTKQIRHPYRWLLLILLAGLVLRWTYYDWAEGYNRNMQGDGIQACSVTMDYSQGEALSQYIGQPNYNSHSKVPGPLWTLYCLAGWKLTGSPQGILLLTLFFSVASIFPAWLLGKWAMDERLGLWTAFLFATFPRALTYCTGVYNPLIMQFFGGIFFVMLWRATHRNASRASFWLGFIPLVSLQFHMSGLLLAPMAVVLLLLAGARVNWLWLGAGLAAGALCWTPYIAGEMGNHWHNTQGMFASGDGGYSPGALKVIPITIGFLVSWSPGWPRVIEEYAWLARAQFGGLPVLLTIYVLSTALAGFVIAGISSVAASCWRQFSWRNRRDYFQKNGMVFLLASVLTAVLFGLVGGKDYSQRYCLIFLTPFYALAAAGLIRWLDDVRVRTWFRPLVLLVILTNFWIVLGSNRYHKDRIANGPVFTPSFRKLETVYQALKRRAGGRPVAVDDTDYLKSIPPGDRFLKDAEMIRNYTIVREKEAWGAHGPTLPPAAFRLSAAEAVDRSDSTVVWSGNGIALMAVPTPVQR